ncbi:MAG: helix-turn-helix domain-containing protein [Candidatus Acidiferrales bacterium]|jgi:DNA-binding XRE family transcriptional regulator
MQVPTVKSLRQELGVSQRHMADMLGLSAKAIQAYEQGWRRVPAHVERLLILHAILHRGHDLLLVPRCWELNQCDLTLRARCPSFRIPHGGFCWFVTGTLCHGEPSGSWAAKRARCLKCQVLQMLLKRPEKRKLSLSSGELMQRQARFDSARRTILKRAPK